VNGRPVSAVHCVLHTGRTHQIRVHLAHSGHALVADALYGGAPALGLARQALHAARLSFTHPATGEALVLTAPLPADMAAAWAEVGAAGLPR
jgi:23S rRNA pseudouridine1911/1915/1917 synthase